MIVSDADLANGQDQTFKPMGGWYTNRFAAIFPSKCGYVNRTEISDNSFGDLDYEGMTRQETTQLAQQEFNKFKKQLQRFGVEIEVFEQEHSLPDSICTDWFMTVRNEIFPKGVLILGAMKTEQRRKERSQQIIDVLSNYYNDVIDLSHFESENLALELQGSIVPDWKNAKIYCSFSHRSDKVVFEYLIGKLNEISQAYTGKLITGITFTSHDMEDKQIYHTDVMLSILDKHIILCAELIRDEDMRDSVIAELTDPDLNDEHRELILISEQEGFNMGANVLFGKDKNYNSCIIISERAYANYKREIKKTLTSNYKVIKVNLENIEKTIGASVASLLSEIH